ncbi:hypothetical protein CPB85DRAFT_1325057 [Mucidula mucida]|nr:hypothetical protein CPB85DRAFT_1325057 [Mucidula mucida]
MGREHFRATAATGTEDSAAGSRSCQGNGSRTPSTVRSSNPQRHHRRASTGLVKKETFTDRFHSVSFFCATTRRRATLPEIWPHPSAQNYHCGGSHPPCDLSSIYLWGSGN